MALSIISNQAASIASRQLEQANNEATASAEKLSSGKRVNSAKDDAASSAIAARLTAEVSGLQTAGVNAGQASSLLQISDGAFQNVEDILTRAKSLAVQAGSDTITDTERGFLDQEFQALKDEIDRISADTEFNGNNLVDGTFATGTGLSTNGVSEVAVRNVDLRGNAQGITAITMAMVSIGGTGGTTVTAKAMISDANGTVMFTNADGFMTTGGGAIGTAQVLTLMATSGEGTFILRAGEGGTLVNANGTTAGLSLTTGPMLAANTGATLDFKIGTGVVAAEDEIAVSVGSVSSASLGLSGTDITSSSNANNASVAVSAAIDALQNSRSEVGAAQNRLDFAAQNVDLARENQEAARSELEDLNVATEITSFTQSQLLVQAGTSTLSQANNLPQNLLQLFN